VPCIEAAGVLTMQASSGNRTCKISHTEAMAIGKDFAKVIVNCTDNYLQSH
jgi:hypothetical protein